MELTFEKHKDSAYTVLADGQVIGGVQGTSYSANGWKFAVWLAFQGTVPLAAEEGDWPVRFFGTRQEAAEALYQEWRSRNEDAKALVSKSISSESPKNADLGLAAPDEAEKKFLEELRDVKPTGSHVRTDLIYTSLGYALRSELEDTAADACLPSCERCGEPANDTDGERHLCGDCWRHDALGGRIEVSPETLEDLAWDD